MMINPIVYQRIKNSISVKETILKDEVLLEKITACADLIWKNIKAGGKVIFAGNGGSFADAQHLSAEFVSRLKVDRAPMPSIALGTNSSTITAIGNDYGFEYVFARELSAIYLEGDVFIGITTSGKSKNILKAFETAYDLGCDSILLTGSNEIELDNCVISLNVPSDETVHIQEAHIMIGHIICELVEKSLVEVAK